MSEINVTDNMLHDLKDMVIDLQNLKSKVEVLENKTNALFAENIMLKVILEDICHEQSKEQLPKTRRKS